MKKNLKIFIATFIFLNIIPFDIFPGKLMSGFVNIPEAVMRSKGFIFELFNSHGVDPIYTIFETLVMSLVLTIFIGSMVEWIEKKNTKALFIGLLVGMIIVFVVGFWIFVVYKSLPQTISI